MTWEVASFLIVGAVILAGFAWYERSRPPAQVVALVAALAALAIAGRIAFAAFPNVKPTTDIVIFAGYALGGAPGFAVGALAALVSNFWFGQGPWTPWQMAGWGLCGVLGAALALGVRNAGRLALAATCGFAGILYGALLNFSLMATYGGDLTWRHFLVLEARAIPFEIAHVVGNVVLALVAGPAMVRMLMRFRERFEWERGEGVTPLPQPPRRFGGAVRGGGVAILLAIALVVLAPAGAQAASPTQTAEWLESVQNGDGGFGPSASDESGTATTCWVMLGLEAAGRNPLDIVSPKGQTPVDFLRKEIGGVGSPGDIARTILALEGAGIDPHDFGGRNLVAELLGARRDNGSYHGWPNSTAFAVIALRAAGVDGGVQKSLDWLRKVQNEDGGWGDTPGSPSTTDGTGAVMQALSPDSKAAGQGLFYLRHQGQQKGGGFPIGGNGAVNTMSTAWAIQGILAVGGSPDSFRRGSVSAPEYLAHNQREDGSYRYSNPDQTASEVANQTPVWVTGEVLVAAAGKFFPIAAAPREPKPKAPKSNPASSHTGGASPSLSGSFPSFPPGTVPPALEKSLKGAVGGLPPGHSAPSGKGGSGALPNILPPGGRVPEGDLGSALPGTSASEATGEPVSESTDDSSSTAGAVLLGLLAGCVLFGAGLAGRAGWMRWRYGL
ncbi:MAG: energy-coupling factor transport system substrate-specific component [Solirubrobacterales bacterium]|jgi:energy-coupling factor transport system substrate-specific component|nr:energy-coupling factor transport system substrate-specific component [Solirubrobacterales bacterium]